MTKVIAEIGVNHEGDVTRALSMIDACAEAKAWAVKFQLFTPELLEARPERVKLLRSWVLTKRELMRCRKRAEKHGLAWGASAFDDPSVELLRSLGPDFQKAACGQRWPGMRWVTRLRFESFTRSMTPRGDAIPFLCVPRYPAQFEDYMPIPAWACGISDHVGNPFGYTNGSSLARGLDYAEAHVTDRFGTPDDRVSWHVPTTFLYYIKSVNHRDTAEPTPRTRVELKRPIKGQRVAWLRGGS